MFKLKKFQKIKIFSDNRLKITFKIPPLPI